MRNLLYPHSIAIIGASNNTQKVGSLILQNILGSNYGGEILLVNRNESTIHGMPCVQDVSDLPSGIDVAIVVIPAKFVLDVIRELGKKKTKYAVIISAGFKESGEAGLAAERELQAIAAEYHIRLVGPNCLGVINTDADKYAYNGSFGIPVVKSGNVSLISQSGALISSFVDRADQRSFGFNKILSVGNKSDIDEAEMIEYLSTDPKTEVIALYLEGVNNPVRFIQAIQACTKPVVVLKSGRSTKAAEAIASHTGSIVGESQQISTALTEAGAIEVKGFDELFDVLHLFSRHREVSRYDAAIITNAGGVGVLSVDAAEDFTVSLSEFQERTLEQLTTDLPPAAAVENPVDVLGDATWERYRLAIETTLSEKHVGSALVMLTPQIMTPIREIAEGIVQMQERFDHKVIIPVFIGGTVIQEARDIFIKARLPWFESPEQAMQALSWLYTYTHQTPNAKLWEEPTVYIKKKSRQLVEEAIEANTSDTGLDFAALAVIAEEFELPLPGYHYIRSESDIEPGLKKVGKPCVMKIVAGDMLHRSDVGGVKVGITTKKEATDFWSPRQEFEIIMQEQAKKGIEVFVGIKRDPEWGPFLVLGWGGIYAEIIDDFAMTTVPATKPMILKTLKSTKLYRVLTGARGTEYDVQFLIDTIFQLSLFALSFPQVAEIDVNPIILYEKGGSMVDFKVVVG